LGVVVVVVAVGVVVVVVAAVAAAAGAGAVAVAVALAVAVVVVVVDVVVVVVHTFAQTSICSRQIQIGLTNNIFHSQGKDVMSLGMGNSTSIRGIFRT
jgi:hypothetical protein